MNVGISRELHISGAGRNNAAENFLLSAAVEPQNFM